MTAENPEAVLEDGADDQLLASPLTLLVATLLTCIVVAGMILGRGVAIELYALTVTVWVLGAFLRALEVSQR